MLAEPEARLNQQAIVCEPVNIVAEDDKSGSNVTFIFSSLPEIWTPLPNLPCELLTIPSENEPVLLVWL